MNVPSPENCIQLTASAFIEKLEASATVATQPVPPFTVPSVTNSNEPGNSELSFDHSVLWKIQAVLASPFCIRS